MKTKICKNCGVEYKTGGHVYCSPACRYEYVLQTNSNKYHARNDVVKIFATNNQLKLHGYNDEEIKIIRDNMKRINTGRLSELIKCKCTETRICYVCYLDKLQDKL